MQKANARKAAETAATFNWQQRGWPEFMCDRAALCDELRAFEVAFSRVRAALEGPQNSDAVMSALVDEAVTTSAIEGIRVDECVVMSSICKALGLTCAPLGFVRDVRAEGVAQMMLQVRADWRKRISAKLICSWHAALLAGDSQGICAGAFRSHVDPMRVVRRNAYGEVEIRFEAPPSERVPAEIARFVEKWKSPAKGTEGVALKAALLHLHFESIHPFEDGNGRVGRALVAKTLAEGLDQPLVLPVSLVIDRHRKAYYEELYRASRSLDWTTWAKFFIPVLTEALDDFLFDLVQQDEPMDDPLNDPIKQTVLNLVQTTPGLNREQIAVRLGKSVATAKRALAALVTANKVEHRGSKKTGGYYIVSSEENNA